MLDYAVAIPTRGMDRADLLKAWLPPACWFSADPPALILIINNNEGLTDSKLLKHIQHSDRPIPLEVMSNPFPTKSDAAGSQAAFQHLWRNYRTIVKWDDDLIPESDCWPRLVGLVEGGFAAAGGMYYRLMDPRRSCMDHGSIKSGDEHQGHVQFFRWNSKHTVLRRRHLYSSFAYDGEAAHRIGGFWPEYSRLSYRHETDFTLRIDQHRPGLAVDTAAEAMHLVSEGGVREITPMEYKAFAQQDSNTFATRMKERGIVWA